MHLTNKLILAAVVSLAAVNSALAAPKIFERQRYYVFLVNDEGGPRMKTDDLKKNLDHWGAYDGTEKEAAEMQLLMNNGSPSAEGGYMTWIKENTPDSITSSGWSKAKADFYQISRTSGRSLWNADKCHGTFYAARSTDFVHSITFTDKGNMAGFKLGWLLKDGNEGLGVPPMPVKNTARDVFACPSTNGMDMPEGMDTYLLDYDNDTPKDKNAKEGDANPLRFMGSWTKQNRIVKTNEIPCDGNCHPVFMFDSKAMFYSTIVACCSQGDPMMSGGDFNNYM